MKSIIEKIRALREKTQANGCTEAEALAAAAKVAQLMTDHAVSETDLEFGEASATFNHQARGPRGKLAPVIAYYTNTASMLKPDGRKVAFIFVGKEPWTEVAAYVLEVCETAIDAELKKFKQTPFYRQRRKLATRRLAASDFVEGMVLRLCGRIRDLFESHVNEAAGDSARNALRERHGTGVAVKQKARQGRYSQAANAGWRRGGDVNLAHGVAGAKEPQRLVGLT